MDASQHHHGTPMPRGFAAGVGSLLFTRSSGPRGVVSMFPDALPARGRLTRRYTLGL
jgi:hypothetical protein